MLPLLLAFATAAPPEVSVIPVLPPGPLVAARQVPPVAPPPTAQIMPPPAQPGPLPQPQQSNWNRLFAPPPAEMCSPPTVQPFYKQPRVCPVAICECDDAPPASRPARLWVKEFSRAASVPLPRFDQNGQTVCGDGLIIYEGMRLTVDPDTGLYDLTFTATVPSTSVILRMQLSFTKTSTDPAHIKIGDGAPCPEPYTLTLPPIVMHPPRDAKPGDPVGNTFHISHRGYSTLFLKDRGVPVATEALGGHMPETITRHWEIKRDGTARFGTPVAIQDQNR